MSTILVGDIGGTKTTLGLYTFLNQGFECIEQQTYFSHDFDQFNVLLQEFIDQFATKSLKVMALSIAGPIINHQCKTTNLPWTISAKDLEQTFSITKVILLNDIEATGLGLIQAKDSELIQINPKAQFIDGNRAIISIGTGLGEAFLFWNEERFYSSGAEGGHEDFAPQRQSDIELWQYLHEHHPDHISYERVVSGPGIALIYDFLCHKQGVENIAPLTDKSAWISAQAMSGNDPTSIECMNIFTRLLANEAANLALKTFSLGGIYIAGGIAPKIISLLQRPLFLDQFTDKGRFKDLLTQIPVWINRNEQAPLIGALEKARKTLLELDCDRVLD